VLPEFILDFLDFCARLGSNGYVIDEDWNDDADITTLEDPDAVI
jgi:hypothetical protein